MFTYSSIILSCVLTSFVCLLGLTRIVAVSGVVALSTGLVLSRQAPGIGTAPRTGVAICIRVIGCTGAVADEDVEVLVVSAPGQVMALRGAVFVLGFNARNPSLASIARIRCGELSKGDIVTIPGQDRTSALHSVGALTGCKLSKLCWLRSLAKYAVRATSKIEGVMLRNGFWLAAFLVIKADVCMCECTGIGLAGACTSSRTGSCVSSAVDFSAS